MLLSQAEEGGWWWCYVPRWVADGVQTAAGSVSRHQGTGGQGSAGCDVSRIHQRFYFLCLCCLSTDQSALQILPVQCQQIACLEQEETRKSLDYLGHPKHL